MLTRLGSRVAQEMNFKPQKLKDGMCFRFLHTPHNMIMTFIYQFLSDSDRVPLRWDQSSKTWMQSWILKKFHLITHRSVWSIRVWALTRISFKTHLRNQLKVTFNIVLVKHKNIHYSLYKKYRRLISGFCGTEESRMLIVLRVNSIGSGWSYRWKRIFEDWSNQSWIRHKNIWL